MTEHQIRYVTAEEVRRRISIHDARALIERALLSGFDPAVDPRRVPVPAGSGHLLLMPSVLDDWVGVKIASVSPANPDRELPRIQALYMLMDSETLTPKLIIDGSALTELRTPATTAIACDRLASATASRLVVFGSGPQAIEHVVALSAIRDFEDIRMVGRSTHRLETAVNDLDQRGIEATPGSADDITAADVVVCATSSGQPLFDASLIRPGTCVAAMGSHEATMRELPGELFSEALVIVEDYETALREAGDIVMAVAEGHLSDGRLNTLSDLVTGKVERDPERINVFKGTGMSWQDLAVASGLTASL